MIQQYGPLVRNLPAMIKLYSQLGSADDDETNTNDADEEPKEITAETDVPHEPVDDEIEEGKEEEPEDILVKKGLYTHQLLLKQNRKRSGSSIPKLYV